MKNLIFAAMMLFSLSASASQAFLIRGWSSEFEGAKRDAIAQASRQCGHPARLASKWSFTHEPRTIWRCRGRAEDRECDDLVLGTNYYASAYFRCN